MYNVYVVYRMDYVVYVQAASGWRQHHIGMKHLLLDISVVTEYTYETESITNICWHKVKHAIKRMKIVFHVHTLKQLKSNYSMCYYFKRDVVIITLETMFVYF